MSDLFKTLLATDSLAQTHGVALHPRLRAAMQADLRFPARAASPTLALTPAHLDDPRVTRLSDHAPGQVKAEPDTAATPRERGNA
ncbi:hypothetical protein NBRC116586_04150 [Pseudooceanicola nitratireducens]|uniref:hypothetical protein n=1 Tax=Pseudooceanicola nitratireducens TaxID=517719 RepID=UPI0031061C5B